MPDDLFAEAKDIYLTRGLEDDQVPLLDDIAAELALDEDDLKSVARMQNWSAARVRASREFQKHNDAHIDALAEQKALDLAKERRAIYERRRRVVEGIGDRVLEVLLERLDEMVEFDGFESDGEGPALPQIRKIATKDLVSIAKLVETVSAAMEKTLEPVKGQVEEKDKKAAVAANGIMESAKALKVVDKREEASGVRINRKKVFEGLDEAYS